MSQNSTTDTDAKARTNEPDTASDTNQKNQDTPPTPPRYNPHTKRGIPKRTIFFGACAVVAILAFCAANADSIGAVFSNIGDILSPLVIGGVIAYLCNPIMRFFEYVVFGKMKKGGLHHALSLMCTVIVFFGIIAGIIALIIPQLIDSIQHLISHSDEYLLSLLGSVNDLIQKITANLPVDIDISTPEKLMELLAGTFGSLEDLLKKALSALSGLVMDSGAVGSVWNIVTGLFSTLTDLLLGLFIAFYILSSKEKRSAQVRKFRAAYFTDGMNKKFHSLVRLVNQTFGAYIKGLILDSICVGLITFLALTIFGITDKYNILIAAICAITNVIPVFGPFIGAVPSGLIVLITNPDKLIPFIIIILVIQQIEGNIILPRIQGTSTNISSLSVLVAITVMGSLFGVVGMIIGVPVFAILIELGKRVIDERLRRRGRVTDTVHYYPKDAVGNAEEEVYYEHSHLRYMYEHSKLKVRVDRFRAKRAAKRAAKGKPEKSKKEKKQKNKKSGNTDHKNDR